MNYLYSDDNIKTILKDEHIAIKRDGAGEYVSIFDIDSGKYIRTGVIKDGKDTGVDPFMSCFPELIDIGVMGFCKNAGLCTVGCYQGGKSAGTNMTLSDYRSIIDQCRGKVFQVALGGAGSPDEHENFKELLEYARENYIVPNYTTSGIGVDWDTAQLTKQYCGAVAVSEYGMPYTDRAIRNFLRAGCKTNIHYVVSNETIDDAIRRLEHNDFYCDINAVIFLLYKPVGLGVQDKVISPNDSRLQRFFEAVTKPHPFKVGFDSCTIPGIVNFAKDIDMNSVDTCEGGRWSCYIHADMTMVPCSFDQQRRWGVSLREHSIQEAWNSPEFNDFRSHMSNACPQCDKRENCMGGCPILPGIVLCKEKGNE